VTDLHWWHDVISISCCRAGDGLCNPGRLPCRVLKFGIV